MASRDDLPGDSGCAGGASVRRGDVVALLPRLRRYAAALTGSVPDGDDLTQDCMERALVHHRSVRDPGALFGWMVRILHNLHAGDHRRRRARGVAVPLDDVVEAIPAGPSPSDRADAADLARALGRLPDDQRQVILLTALEGMSYREIAAILDVPVGTVMSRLARGRERLRLLLEGEERPALRRIK